MSNDNPHSESHFKTLKYSACYPGRFDDTDHARRWVAGFLDEYHQRPHQGLALYSPADVFHGRVDEIWRRRQTALEDHHARHPQRYVNGPPKAARPPDIVCINPIDGGPETAQALLARPGAIKHQLPDVENGLPEVVT